MRKIRYLYYDFIQGIKNLKKWFPVIWRDRNWDHHYMFEILKFKLEIQSSYLKKHCIHTDAQHNHDRMKLCIKLIDKIQNSYYELEYLDYQKSKYDLLEDKSNISSIEKLRLICSIGEENFDDYISKYKSTHKKAKTYMINHDIDITKNNIALIISILNHQKAKNLLFKIMNQDIEKWWH